MIAFVEHPEALASFSGNAFACRIRATAAAYGFAHPFARFWVQGRGAALCLLDDVMILDARAGADFDELAAFLPAALLLGLVLRKPLIRMNAFFEARLENTHLM